MSQVWLTDPPPPTFNVPGKSMNGGGGDKNIQYIEKKFSFQYFTFRSLFPVSIALTQMGEAV